MVLTESFEEKIDDICNKIVERKKISKVIRLSHEEMVLIRWALVYSLHRTPEDGQNKKLREALKIVTTKHNHYE